jgi:hypothetical protein
MTCSHPVKAADVFLLGAFSTLFMWALFFGLGLLYVCAFLNWSTVVTLNFKDKMECINLMCAPEQSHT